MTTKATDLVLQDLPLRVKIKELVRAYVDEKSGRSFGSFARWCAINESSFSRFLAEKSYVTPDQLYTILERLKLKSFAKQILNCQLIEETSQNEARIADARQERQRLGRAYLNAEAYLDLDDSPVPQRYYLEPKIMLLHMCFNIPALQGQPEACGKALGMSASELTSSLAFLANHGFIEADGSGWQSRRTDMHLPAASPIFRSHRQMMRLLQLKRVQELPSDRQYSFMATFDADAKTREFIQAKFLEFLDTIKPVITSGGSDNLYQIAFDLFDWTSAP